MVVLEEFTPRRNSKEYVHPLYLLSRCSDLQSCASFSCSTIKIEQSSCNIIQTLWKLSRNMYDKASNFFEWFCVYMTFYNTLAHLPPKRTQQLNIRPSGLICEVVHLGFGPQLKSLCSFTQRWLLCTSRDSNIAFSCKNFQDIHTFIFPKNWGISLAVQWLRHCASSTGLIAGWGTKILYAKCNQILGKS